jgi:hypothetical protein
MVLILGAIDSRNACYALHCRHLTAEPSDVRFRRQQSQVTKLNGCNQPISITQPPTHCDGSWPIAVSGQVRSHDGSQSYSGHWLRPARDRLAYNCSPKDTNIFCSVAFSAGVANHNSPRITH